ncbi:hypothetical protein BHS09_35735 [Myxococcus xanthus]|uniref:Uncharacterized protein n=1 Tax=Myxococcus xanthus TaxID=34 RepID=A0AAE6KWC8_MYXXA|nr:hypothetical protein [Myxococcus xanthus]QDE71905.1 hypothetical protein BHS09_35735 [Myxococcus xanthus]QDE79186.1 hypothetical protein BHS08_35760 [Myxococcus xanthus]
MSDFRRATRDDNTALLDLFGAVPMQGDLVLSSQRAPDYFGLYAMQRGETEVWVHGEHGRLDGMGAVHVRDGWLEGRPCRVGYLGDLRTRFSARRSRGLARFYGPMLEESAQRLGVDTFLTAVMASNATALQALVRRRPGRVSQPHYALLRRFSAVSIQFLHRRRPRRSAFAVRRATPEDVPAVSALLAADHRARPFGYRFDTGELEHRLAHWPGLRIEDTYLAFDTTGALVGCTTAWNPEAVKRYRVHAYRGSMRWVRWGWNTLATAVRAPRLPAPGSDFRYFYLCNTSVRGEDPAVLRALVERVYADFHGQGFHFFTLYQDELDPLAPALKGFLQRRLDFHLYAVTPASRPRDTFPAGRTGFEICLP